MSGASQAAFVLSNLRDRAATAAARCFPADWERNAKNKSHGRYMLSCKSYTWRLTTASIKMTEL